MGQYRLGCRIASQIVSFAHLLSTKHNRLVELLTLVLIQPIFFQQSRVGVLHNCLVLLDDDIARQLEPSILTIYYEHQIFIVYQLLIVQVIPYLM